MQASGARAVLLSADAVSGRVRSGVVPLAGRPVTALLTDPLLTRAATAPPATPVASGPGAAATAESLAGDGGPLATQDLLGAVAFRAGADSPVVGPIVLAPPHQWGTDGAGARALLDAVGALVTAGQVTPTRLADAAGDAAAPTPVRPDPPVDAAEVPAAAVGTLADSARALTDLRSAVVESNVGITADQLFAPLQFGLLRGASAANRASPPAAQDAAAAVLARVDAIRNSIRVLEPPNPYALGSSDAPLPVTVANALPVTVRVQVQLKSTSGLRVAPIDVQQIPPLGRRQVSVNAQVTRAGQFTVDAVVSTPDGGLLGPPSHLKVRSTAYGTITAWLTAIAGGLLVLLAARRVWRRVREADQPAARVAPGAPPTVDQPADPTVRLPIPSHGSGPPDRAPPPRPTPTPRPIPQAAPPQPNSRPPAPVPRPTPGPRPPTTVGPPATPSRIPTSAPVAQAAPPPTPPLVAAPEDVAPTERLPRPPTPRSRP